MKSCTDACLVALHAELHKVGKGQSLTHAVEQVFQAVIPQLNEQLDDLHEHIEQKPFFKILKIVWNYLMEGICNQIVLDPDSLTESQPKKFLFARKTAALTQYQIEVITNVLDALEEYFHQNGEGLKKQFFKKDSAMK